MSHLLQLLISEAVEEDPSFFQHHTTNYFATLRHLPQPMTRMPNEQLVKK
jgi:hypothetical protein